MRILIPTLFLLAACPRDPLSRGDEPAPDFSLQDVNPTSGTYGEEVSPRDAKGMASAWYFGHAT